MLLTSIATLLIAFAPSFVNGWGQDGHEIIANIAYERLSNEARQEVHRILGHDSTNTNGISPLASIANWADKIRYLQEYHWSGPLHFVDVRDDKIEGGCPSQSSSSRQKKGGENDDARCKFIYPRDCVGDVCAVGAITNYTKHLENDNDVNFKDRKHLRTRSDFNSLFYHPTRIQESLMFLTHFIGDVHQPLHCSRSSDKGGNTIHVHFQHSHERAKSRMSLPRTGHHHPEKWNLHSVWDSGIILRAMNEMFDGSQTKFKDYVVKQEMNHKSIEKWMECSDGGLKQCASQWAEESFYDALHFAYGDEKGQEIVDGMYLSDEYYRTRLPVIQQRLAIAGVRLAATLEIALSRKFQSQT